MLLTQTAAVVRFDIPDVPPAFAGRLAPRSLTRAGRLARSITEYDMKTRASPTRRCAQDPGATAGRHEPRALRRDGPVDRSTMEPARMSLPMPRHDAATWRSSSMTRRRWLRSRETQRLSGAEASLVGEAGLLAPIPDVAGRTRWPGLCARGTLVPDARPTSPSINDAGAGDGRGATGAAATGGGRETNAGESRGDQSRDEEPSHDVTPSS
jgi:hypothetical protein